MSSPRVRRLKSDYERLINRFNNWALIKISSFEGTPPEKYTIEYNILGLYTESDGNISERNEFILEIFLGLEYPRRPPQCRLITPIFHPNFNETEVCAQDNYAASEGLDDLVIRIGQMIAYQYYNTKSPLNGLAAKWASENNEKLPVDAREISPPREKLHESAAAEQPRVASIEQVTTYNSIEKDDKIHNRIQTGINFIKSDKYDDAMTVFDNILADTEYIKDVYYYKAIIDSKIGKTDSAIKNLIIAAKLGHDKACDILLKKGIEY
jgi:ubiquitin-protein ligase